MKHKNIILVVSIFSTLALCSCGHNAIVFGKGLGLRAGFDPEHMSADVSFIYGEQVVVAGRDNIKIKLKTGVNGGQENATASTSADSVFEIEIGQQINGYTVDAVEAGADMKDLISLNGHYPPSGEAVKPVDETPAVVQDETTD
jgi:hypothetical protein